MTKRPDVTTDHYLDAVALCRATLRNDDTGVLALVNSMNVGMTFQALVRMHLLVLGSIAGDGDPRTVDRLLVGALEILGATERP